MTAAHAVDLHVSPVAVRATVEALVEHLRHGARLATVTAETD